MWHKRHKHATKLLDGICHKHQTVICNCVSVNTLHAAWTASARFKSGFQDHAILQPDSAMARQRRVSVADDIYGSMHSMYL